MTPQGAIFLNKINYCLLYYNLINKHMSTLRKQGGKLMTDKFMQVFGNQDK